jgi:hypothetical protein
VQCLDCLFDHSAGAAKVSRRQRTPRRCSRTYETVEFLELARHSVETHCMTLFLDDWSFRPAWLVERFERWFSSWLFGRCSCLRACASASSSGLRSRSLVPRSQRILRLPSPRLPKVRMRTAARTRAVSGSGRTVVPVGTKGRAHRQSQSARPTALPAETSTTFSWWSTNI